MTKEVMMMILLTILGFMAVAVLGYWCMEKIDSFISSDSWCPTGTIQKQTNHK